jgi:energy-coupling factor transport system substrate-specific component
MVILTGVPGSHGILSLVSYVAPGVALDLTMFLILTLGRREFDRLASFVAGIVTNLTGTIMVNLIFLRLPPLFFLVTCIAAALSGGIGGLIAWELYRVARRYRLVRRANPSLPEEKMK